MSDFTADRERPDSAREDTVRESDPKVQDSKSWVELWNSVASSRTSSVQSQESSIVIPPLEVVDSAKANSPTARETELAGGKVKRDSEGRVVQVSSARGDVLRYGYDMHGEVNRFEDGKQVWVRDVGNRWHRQNDGKQWRGDIEVLPDGTHVERDSAGNHEWRDPNGSREIYSRHDLEQTCRTLHDPTCGAQGFQAVLEGKSYRERQLLENTYREMFPGRSLGTDVKWRMSQGEAERTLSLLRKEDGVDHAGIIRSALVDRRQPQLRCTLEAMSRQEIERADKQYKEWYGESIRVAINKNKHVSEATKLACNVYLSGASSRNPADVTNIAKRACRSGDLEMFQEVMRNAPDDTRQYFRSDSGQALLDRSFGATKRQHAEDFVVRGGLSVASQIRGNTRYLGDNEKAIENALLTMTPEQRDSYRAGRAIANQNPERTLTDEQRQHLADYRETRHALADAAGKGWSKQSQMNELAKWEDMILIEGGSLISRVADHRGVYFKNSSVHDVISTIENMDRADWKRLKTDPDFKTRLSQVLDTFASSDDKARYMDIVNRKQSAPSFEASKDAGRPVLDRIRDNMSADNILEAIRTMSPGERTNYTHGKRLNSSDTEAIAFAKKIDRIVERNLTVEERRSAQALLQDIRGGRTAELSLLSRLQLHGERRDATTPQIVREVQQAMDKDPDLRRAMQTPRTRGEQEQGNRIRYAMQYAMGGDFDSYGSSLFRAGGNLPADQVVSMHVGFFSKDKLAAVQDLASWSARATASERERLLSDSSYQSQALSRFSSKEVDLALNAVRQQKLQPEDQIRAFVLNIGQLSDARTALDAIHDRGTYRAQKLEEPQIDSKIAERLNQVKSDYRRKYGTDLSADLLAQSLSPIETENFRKLLNARDEKTEALLGTSSALQSRAGMGSTITDWVWDGTGYQVTHNVHQLGRAIHQNQDIRRHTAQLSLATDAHRESKKAMAEVSTDLLITTTAVVAPSLACASVGRLAMYVGASSSAIKAGGKAVLQGADYDRRTGEIALDIATGLADGATSVAFCGPATAAKSRGGVAEFSRKIASNTLAGIAGTGASGAIRAGHDATTPGEFAQKLGSAIAVGAIGGAAGPIALGLTAAGIGKAVQFPKIHEVAVAVSARMRSAVDTIPADAAIRTAAAKSPTHAAQFSNEAVSKFVEDSYGARWTGVDVKELRDRYAAVTKQMNELRTVIKGDLTSRGLGADFDPHYYDHLPESVRGDIALSQKFDDFKKLEETFFSLSKQLEPQMQQRAQQLQPAVDRFCKEIGLPPVKVYAQEGKEYGSYRDGTGAISLSGALFGNRAGSQLVSTALHELKHAEQDALVIKLIADRLGIKAGASDAQITTVKLAYHRAITGDTSPQIDLEVPYETKGYSDDWFRNVLKSQDGRPLTEAELQRAIDLIEDSQKFHRDFEKMLALEDRVDNLVELSTLFSNESVPLESVLGRPEDWVARTKSLLGTEHLDGELESALNRSIKATAAERSACDAQLRELLSIEANVEARVAGDRWTDAYKSQLKERESYAVGDSALEVLKEQKKRVATAALLRALGE